MTELTLNEGLLLTYSGRPRTPSSLAPVAPDPIPGPGAAGPGRAARARGDRTVRHGADLLGRAFAEQMDLPDQVAIPGPGNHILIRAYALAECGRLPEASRLATAAYEATPASAPPSA